MSSSVVFSSHSLIFVDARVSLNSLQPSKVLPVKLCRARTRFNALVPNSRGKSHRNRRRTSWWKRFFLEDDGNWLGLKDDDMLGDELEHSGEEGEVSEGDKFDAWKRRAEAIVELREAQQDSMNEESRMWEDWLVTDGTASWNDGNGGEGDSGEDLILDSGGRDLVESVSDMILGREDEDMLYEDRVFRYASLNSAKFLAVLIIIPWAMDFLVHDYVLMPFLDRRLDDISDQE